MEAICFDDIGENIRGYIRNSIVLNREVCEKFRRTSSLSLRKKIILL